MLHFLLVGSLKSSLLSLTVLETLVFTALVKFWLEEFQNSLELLMVFDALHTSVNPSVTALSFHGFQAVARLELLFCDAGLFSFCAEPRLTGKPLQTVGGVEGGHTWYKRCAWPRTQKN